jgi:hypothetical protein
MLETGPDNRRIAKTSKLRVKLKPGVYKLEASVSTRHGRGVRANQMLRRSRFTVRRVRHRAATGKS